MTSNNRGSKGHSLNHLVFWSDPQESLDPPRDLNLYEAGLLGYLQTTSFEMP